VTATFTNTATQDNITEEFTTTAQQPTDWIISNIPSGTYTM
jgi:hypothetical protein